MFVEEEVPPAPLASAPAEIKKEDSVTSVKRETSVPTKRKGRDNFDDYPKADDTTKQPAKRRSDPQVDLITIFDTIISRLIAAPDAFEFCYRIFYSNLMYRSERACCSRIL